MITLNVLSSRSLINYCLASSLDEVKGCSKYFNRKLKYFEKCFVRIAILE